MEDFNSWPDKMNRAEARASEEKIFVLGLLKAVPGLEVLLEPGFFSFEEWTSSDGMQFMNHLRLICGRIVGQEIGKSLLPPIFAYLEARAKDLDIGPSDESDRARIYAIDFLLFTFTDDPPGNDPDFKKLAAYMGPKIAKMCGQSPH